MAVYEFKCPDPKCFEEREVRAKLGSEPSIPWCLKHQRTMRRVYSPPAIQFRGSGWASKGG